MPQEWAPRAWQRWHAVRTRADSTVGGSETERVVLPCPEQRTVRLADDVAMVVDVPGRGALPRHERAQIDHRSVFPQEGAPYAVGRAALADDLSALVDAPREAA